MNRIFGKQKVEAPPPTLGDATGRIDASVGRLDEKIAKLEGELRRYKEQMKTAKGSAQTGIKKRAMQTLKQKKMYEQQRDQMAAQSFNVDQTRFALDMVQDQQVAVQAMKAAASSLKVRSLYFEGE
jgi:charged multivesicular body protein 5